MIETLEHCPICDLRYGQPSQKQRHTAYCKRFAALRQKYGDKALVPLQTVEGVKQAGYHMVNDARDTLHGRFLGGMLVLRCWFARSLQGAMSLQHPDFEEYAAMMLAQRNQFETWPPKVYDRLVKMYGTAPGIPRGTCWRPGRGGQIERRG